MIESNAAVPDQGSTYLYGGILYQRVSEPDSRPQSQRAGIGTFLSQGLTIGALIFFLIPLFIVLAYPHGYNFLVVPFLPMILAFGMAVGLVQGLGIWGCTRLARHNPGRPLRAAIGVIIFAIILAGYCFAFPSRFYIKETADLTEYLKAMGIFAAIGVTYGLFTGSRLRPWRVLVREAESLPPGSWLITGITGVVLRLAIVFFLMESILIVVWQVNFPQHDLAFALIALGHFAAALLIVSIRLRFWLLLLLAVIINLPVVTLLTDVLEEANLFMWYLTVSYLTAWAAFLISRCRLTYSALAFVNQEIRYYLID
jgi:hypothetical protein